MTVIDEITAALSAAQSVLGEALQQSKTDAALKSIRKHLDKAQIALEEIEFNSVEEEIRNQSKEYTAMLAGLASVGTGGEADDANRALETLSGRLKDLGVKPLDVETMEADMKELAAVIKQRGKQAESITNVVGTVLRVGKAALGLVT
ncbi:MAG TPA: hypothetical protein VK843_18790 [Planctomycetota bacterium]|nr:hypothetical protein [Planctomycetota bacterium]